MDQRSPTILLVLLVALTLLLILVLPYLADHQQPHGARRWTACAPGEVSESPVI